MFIKCLKEENEITYLNIRDISEIFVANDRFLIYFRSERAYKVASKIFINGNCYTSNLIDEVIHIINKKED